LKFEQLDQRILNWLYVQGLDIIRITHEKLASFLGVSREAVSRNLKKLEQSGAVKLARGAIILT
jgi:CRP/FNR family transcriptional regulator